VKKKNAKRVRGDNFQDPPEVALQGCTTPFKKISPAPEKSIVHEKLQKGGGKKDVQ